MAEDNSGSQLAWFLTGAALGAAAALLLAPQTGDEARRTVRRRALEGRDALERSGRDALARGRELYEQGKELADDAGEIVEKGIEKGKEAVEKVKTRAARRASKSSAEDSATSAEDSAAEPG